MLVGSSQFLLGVEQFNRGEFFESHDTWEEIWHDARGEERVFLQGLIQLAVGYYHRSNAKYHAAVSQLTKGCVKLRRFPPVFEEVRVEELCGEAGLHASECEALARGAVSGSRDFNAPSIRFV